MAVRAMSFVDDPSVFEIHGCHGCRRRVGHRRPANCRGEPRQVECQVPRRMRAGLRVRELHVARSRFDELMGARTSEDVLNRIFERFCIGK